MSHDWIVQRIGRIVSLFLTLLIILILFQSTIISGQLHSGSDKSTGQVELSNSTDHYFLNSPDGSGNLTFYIRNDSLTDDVFGFDFRIENRTVMNGSSLGLKFRNDDLIFKEGMRIESVKRISHLGVYDMPWGEMDGKNDRYNGLTFSLSQRDDENSSYSLEVRFYDEGFAFRYLLNDASKDSNIYLEKDLTNYMFTEDHSCLAQYSQEKPYFKKKLSELDGRCTTPFTIDIDDNIHLSHHEAHVDGFCRSFITEGTGNHSLGISLHSTMVFKLPFKTPWRTVILGMSSGELARNGHIHYALCPETSLNDTTWIVPGKAFRDCSLTTRGSKEIIDFCRNNSMQYVHLDAGWYGNEWSGADPRTVSATGLNLSEVIRYGRENGIGVILYVNIRGFSIGLTSILDTYENWGIKGIKLGFVDGLSKGGINQVHNIVREAAIRKLIVDIHDNYRPTGMSRTYPNLLTQEGVRGNEQYPTGEENTYLHFSRALAGPMDYTPMLAVKETRTTLVHQLSIPFILYSPLTYLYWYQTPEKLKDINGTDAWDFLPSVWNETKFLGGHPCSHVTTARRNGDDWVLASLNGKKSRSVDVTLDFLSENKSYNATIYRDDNGSISCSSFEVNRSTRIHENMISRGGSLIIFRKDNNTSSLKPYPPFLLPIESGKLDEKYDYRFGFIVKNGFRIFNYTITPSNERIQIDTETGDLIFKPNHEDLGKRTFNISVFLGNNIILTSNLSFIVFRENEPPEITSDPPETVFEDSLLSVPLTADDPDPEDKEMKWTMNTNCSFISIRDNPMRLEGMPENEHVGLFWINLSVDDLHGGYDHLNFTIQVLNINDPPVINIDPILTVSEENWYMLNLNGTDPDPVPTELDWELITDADFLEIDTANNTIFGFPDDPDVGDHDVEIILRDGTGGHDNITFLLSVLSVNDMPEIKPPYVPNGFENVPFGFQMHAFDPDDVDFEWEIESNASFLQINKLTGLVYGIPGDRDAGQYNATISVRDIKGGFSSIHVGFNITGINERPRILDSELPPATEDIQYSYILSYIDSDIADGESVAWFLNGPEFLSIDKNFGFLYGTPSNDDVGLHEIKITVMDGNGGTTIEEFFLTVQNTNDPPILKSFPENEIFVYEDVFYDFDLNAIDPDPGVGSLKWTINRGPEGMTIESESGVIEWLPGNEDVGRHTVRIEVNDGDGGKVEFEFDMVVLNTNDPPEITTDSLEIAYEDKPYFFEIQGEDSDPGDYVLKWYLNSGDLGFLTIDPINGVIGGIPDEGDTGVWDIEITAEDSIGSSTTRRFELEIIGLNDPPESKTDEVEISVLEDNRETVNLREFFIDTDTDRLYFSLDGAEHISFHFKGEELTINPGRNWFGTEEIMVNATDGQYNASIRLVVSVIPVNDPPLLPEITIELLTYNGRSVKLHGHSWDHEDEYNLTFQWYSSMDGNIGEGNEIDARMNPGKHTITLVVKDDEGLTSTSTLDIEISDENGPVSEDSSEESTTISSIILVLIFSSIFLLIFSIVLRVITWNK